MKDTILSSLSRDYPWKDQLQYFPSLHSTNDALKDLAKQGAPHGTALIAGQQTGGRGRLGRSFHSPEGMGLYLSILLRPGCRPAELMHLTCAAATAACDAVEKAARFRPGIKWTNDLVYGTRKLGGILTELGLTPQGMVDYAIIGIGVNCRQKPGDFPESIRDMATSLDMAAGKETNPAKLAAAMLDAFQKMDDLLMTQKEAILRQYRMDCVTLGQEICVIRGDTVHHGRALNLNAEGALIVEYCDGTVEAVNSGEVSIRGMYGYL